MMLKDAARYLRNEVVPLARLRKANPEAVIGAGVKFLGDYRACSFAKDAYIQGPTVMAVVDGGGLSGSRLEIGARTYVGEFNNIRTGGAAVLIGADCLISQHITIVGTNHGIAAGRKIVDQPWEGTGVIIGDDVWVGAGAVILPGARIGDGAVIAANAVVRGVVESGAVVGGIPARVLAQRE